jgi:dTDP-glucose 4,6-dehydratase
MTPPLTVTSATLQATADTDFTRLTSHISVEELREKTILITGATGFFGAWLLSLFDWLNRTQGARIRVIAVSRQPKVFLEKNPHFHSVPWLTWITGDVRDFAFPDVSVDYLIHAATDTSAAAGQDPMRLFDTIVQGTRHTLACAKQNGAKRILLVSSGAVYGAQQPDVLRMTETTPTAPSPLLTANAYGEGKRVMELLGAIHAQEASASVVVARCFAFVGAGLPLDAHFAIGNFIRDALGKDKITIKGGGTAERSYLYAADLAIWLVRLLVSGKSGQAYNVGSDRALTIAELAHCVVDTLSPGKEVSIEGKDNPNGGRNRYIPSIDLAREQCGLDVWTDIGQAIALTAAYRP